MASSRPFVPRFVALLLVVLVISAIWLYAFPAANLVYVAVIVLHVGVGVIATFALIPRLIASFRDGSMVARGGWLLMAVAGLLGLVLMHTGALTTEWKLLYSHIAIAVVASVLLFANWLRLRGTLSTSRGLISATVALLIVSGLIAYGAQKLRVNRWEAANRIVNPKLPPETMNGEGDGPNGHFFPSSAQTKHKGYIPPNYFVESDACQRCHQDVYKQWQS